MPLSWLLLASVAPDLLVLPFFHTAPAIAAQAAVAFAVGRARYSTRGGVALSTLVLLHFGVDLLTSSVALLQGGPEAGLRLYDRPAIDFAVEAGLIVIGWTLWRRTLPDLSRNSALRMLVLLLASQAFFSLFVAGSANG